MTQLSLFPTEPVEPDPVADTQPTEALPEHVQVAALRRRRYVAALEDLPLDRRSAADLGAAIEVVSLACGDDDPPSPGSVRRWASRFRRAGRNLAGLADRRAARPAPRGSRWAPWIVGLADEAADQARADTGRTLTALADRAMARCREEAHRRGCSPREIPTFDTLLRMIRARLRPEKGWRIDHLSCGRPLDEVVVGLQTLRLGIPELGNGPVYLMTARDTYSGVIVAAALSVAEPAGDDLFRLFGVRVGTAASQPLGAARLCMGIPELLVLDQAGLFHDRTFRDAAEALGITLNAAPAASDDRDRASHLQPWLEARGDEVATVEGLMAAVQAWLAHHDRRRSPPDWRTPLDRWQEGLARYGIKLAATSTGDGTGRGDHHPRRER